MFVLEVYQLTAGELNYSALCSIYIYIIILIVELFLLLQHKQGEVKPQSILLLLKQAVFEN